MKKQYFMGNSLRGYYEGEFKSIDEAWSFLSNRFLLSFPSESGRHVGLFVKDKNEFGFEDFKQCKEGITEINTLPRKSVVAKTRRSFAII